MTEDGFRCGTIAIVGRPNVGKSTLLNNTLGVKLSITSRKPQTTRHQLLGIHTDPHTQFLFVDTPGYQQQHLNGLNRSMNQVVKRVISDVDVILFLVEAENWTSGDRLVLEILPQHIPVLLVINKVDLLHDKKQLLPFITECSAQFAYAEIVPVSARTQHNVPQLLSTVRHYLPQQPAIYSADDLTDRSERFLAAELLREKIFRFLGDEIPYSTTVEIDKFEQTDHLRRIYASIVIEKESQKPILLGNQGEKLKQIATEARQDMEKLFHSKVWLETWVKTRKGWMDNERALKTLGY